MPAAGGGKIVDIAESSCWVCEICQGKVKPVLPFFSLWKARKDHSKTVISLYCLPIRAWKSELWNTLITLSMACWSWPSGVWFNFNLYSLRSFNARCVSEMIKLKGLHDLWTVAQVPKPVWQFSISPALSHTLQSKRIKCVGSKANTFCIVVGQGNTPELRETNLRNVLKEIMLIFTVKSNSTYIHWPLY